MQKLSKEKIFYIWLLLQPIIDLIVSLTIRNSDCSITIGIILRGLFLLTLLLVTIFSKKIKNKKNIYAYFIVLFVYFILYMLIRINENSFSFGLIVSEVKYIFKYFYYPIVLLTMYQLKDYFELDNDKLKKILVINLFIITFSIILSYLTNSAYSSYGNGNSGIVGWFYSANEIGAILVILYPYTFLIKNNKQVIFNTIVMLLTIISSIYMGTKTTYFGIILSLVFYIIYILLFKIKDSVKAKYKVSYITLSVILLVTLSFISPMFKNIENTTNEYKDNDNVIVDNVIFSSRLNFLKIDSKIYKESNIADKFFGIGLTGDDKRDYPFEKRSELDFCDLFLRYGILGFILYMLPIVILLIKMIKICFIEKLKNIDNILPLYSIFIGSVISAFAGHVISSPAVSIYLVMSSFIILNIGEKTNEKEG